MVDAAENFAKLEINSIHLSPIQKFKHFIIKGSQNGQTWLDFIKLFQLFSMSTQQSCRAMWSCGSYDVLRDWNQVNVPVILWVDLSYISTKWQVFQPSLTESEIFGQTYLVFLFNRGKVKKYSWFSDFQNLLNLSENDFVL